MSSTVRNVFYLVGTIVVALLLYALFFTSDNNALKTISNSLQKSLAGYYYNHCYEPAVNQYAISDSEFGVKEDSKVYNLDPMDNLDTCTILDEDKVVYDTGWY